MGGAVSTGKDNHDLVDKLAAGNYIKSVLVEKLFRGVDRGHYFLSEHADQAYRDSAWRSGNIHMSAPCIYSEVLEALDLRPGLSFLNLGSGTGYLSTMVGMALGPYGVSHGIELHSDVVEYAISRFNAFISEADAVDEFDDLCPPIFVVGNCLQVSTSQKYDRIYCGAACPESLLGRLKELLRPGGVLVVPVTDRLLQYRLSSDGTWSQKVCMPVSFAGLIIPKPLQEEERNGDDSSDNETLEPPQLGINSMAVSVRDRIPVIPSFIPPSLQHLCRFTIRRHLRDLITLDYPELLDKRLFDREATKKQRQEERGQEDTENDAETEEVDRSHRRRTRYLRIGNNFGVVIISENASSTEDDSSDSDDETGDGGNAAGAVAANAVAPADRDEMEEDSATGGNRTSEIADSVEKPVAERSSGTTASGVNEGLPGASSTDSEDTFSRPVNVPPLLRLLLESRRLNAGRGENRRTDENEMTEDARNDDAEGDVFSPARRRRRESSNASTAAEVKKQKETTDDGSPSEADTADSVESTGRRISRHLHERVHALELPTSLERYLLYGRSSPPPPPTSSRPPTDNAATTSESNEQANYTEH